MHGSAMARQLCALGRALSAVSLSAPGCVARAGAPLGLGSMRAFSAAGADPPADGACLQLRPQRAALTRAFLQAPLGRRWEAFAKRSSADCRVRSRCLAERLGVVTSRLTNACLPHLQPTLRCNKASLGEKRQRSLRQHERSSRW